MRKMIAAPLLALALSIPAAAPALAHTRTALGQAVHGSSDGSGTGGHASGSGGGSGHDGRTDRHRPDRVLFEGGGTVTAVDATAATLTFTVERGVSHALHGQSVTVSVPALARIRRDGATATLADVVAGDHVRVRGFHTGTGYTVLRVEAEDATATPEPSESAEPTESAEPSSTAEPTASAPTHRPRPSRSPRPTATPTGTPSVTPTTTPSVTPTASPSAT